MSDKFVDLHIHTNLSDGSFTPSQVVRLAREKGISAIAITDHDTVKGIEEALAEGEKEGVEVIAGVELSCDCCGEEVHVVGLFVDWKDKEFQETLEKRVRERERRVKEILKKLEDLGMMIPPQKMENCYRGKVPGRLLIARIMVEKGWVKDLDEAFEKYLNEGGLAYVPSRRKTGREIVEIIEKAKGIPVLAHPQYLDKPEMVIPEMVREGIKGLEVYFPENGKTPSPQFLFYAEKYHLLVSAGSDCHGENKERVLLGTVRAPYSILEEMKKWHRQRYGY